MTGRQPSVYAERDYVVARSLLANAHRHELARVLAELRARHAEEYASLADRFGDPQWADHWRRLAQAHRDTLIREEPTDAA